MSLTSVVVVTLGMILAGALKGASGVGFPSIATPIVATVLGVRTAAIVLAVPSFLINAAQLVKLKVPREQLRPAAGYLAGMAVGLIAGTRILLVADDLPLGLIMGAVGLTYVAVRFARPSRRLPLAATQAGGAALGLISGALKGATNVSGPIMVLYLQNRSLSKEDFTAVSAFILQFTGALRLGLLLASGAFDLQGLLYAALLLVPAAVGLVIGELVRKRLSERLFSHVTTGVLGMLSALLIVTDLFS